MRPSIRRAMRRPLDLAEHDSASFNDCPTAKGLHLHSTLLLDEDCHLIGLTHLHFWVHPTLHVENDESKKKRLAIVRERKKPMPKKPDRRKRRSTVRSK